MRIVCCLVLCLMFIASSSPTRAEAPVPLEKLILQQHFTQKELERNLALMKEEERELLVEMAKLDLEIKRREQVMESLRRHAGKVAYAYYTGERTSLLMLLLDSKNFNDFLNMAEFLHLLFQQDMDKLKRYQSERATTALLYQKKQERLTEIREIRKQYEERLKEIAAIRLEKEKNLEKLTDPTTVDALMEHLVADWRSRGLPAFHMYFQQLSKVMMQISELATPEHITANGLLTHTLTIDEEEFNQFLASKHDMFKQSRFQFTDNQLIVEGSYEQMNLRIVGEYEIVSPQLMQFHIKELQFDGYQLPASTIREMEKEYDLAFYPNLISPNINVEELTLANSQLKLKLSLDFPFSFGKK